MIVRAGILVILMSSLVLVSRRRDCGCQIFGYAGMTNQDHFDHLYGAADLFRMTSVNSKDGP